MAERNRALVPLFGLVFTLCLGVEARQWGLSAVTLKDQYQIGFRYSHTEKVRNWVSTGVPGLFMNGKFANSDNSTFLINTPGVYYVSANIIVEVGRYVGGYHYGVNQLNGGLYLKNDRGWGDRSGLKSSIQLNSSSNQVSVRISGYVLAQSGWQASIKIVHTRRSITVKAGSTFSLVYTSKPFAFPGIQLVGSYQRIEFTSPSYSGVVQKWANTGYSSTMFSMSNGSFITPSDGLYHVVTNIKLQRRTDVEYKFAILVDNTVEVVSRRKRFVSEGSDTVTMECLLNLSKNQAISISISSNKTYASLHMNYGSSFFICLKNEIGNAVPGVSASFRANNKLFAKTWNPLIQWSVNSQPPLHFGNTQLHSGQFVSPQSGFYYISFVVSLKSCAWALAKLTLRLASDDVVKSIGPGFSFTPRNKECFMDVSLIIRMMQNDTLLVSIKSNENSTIQPSTTLQVLFYSEFHFWPAAQLTLKRSFPFTTNQPRVIVKYWSPSVPKIGYYSFFDIESGNIKIKASGLYIVTCSLVVNKSSNVESQFESWFNIRANGKSMTSGSPCRRSKTPQSFTCTTSALLNLLEKDSLAVVVKMNDTSGKKELAYVLALSRISILLVGDTRSHPAFKLGVQNNNNLYVTKAKTATMTSLTDFSLSNPTNTFFQTAAMYSKLDSNSNRFGFKTGSGNAFFISSSIQFQLLNDGELSSVIGSKKQYEHAYARDQTKGFTSVLSSAITVDDHFYFNVSDKASSTDFKWETRPGSITSGVYIGNKQSTTAFWARINSNVKASAHCSNTWTQVGDWIEIKRMKNPGTFNDQGFKVSEGGSFYMFLNFVIKSKVPKKDVEVGVFLDHRMVLFARESTPHESNFFSILLQGLVTLRAHQIVDVKIKCPSSSGVTLSKETSMSCFRVDKPPIIPGLHWPVRLTYGYYSYSLGVRKFMPNNYFDYQNLRDSDSYTIDVYFNRSTQITTVSRTGVYFISVIGNFNYYFKRSLAFFSDSSSTRCLNSAPLYYEDFSNDGKYVSMTGFAFLKEGQDFGLFASGSRYYYSSALYLSLHYMGDLETTSGVTATLSHDKILPRGTNTELTDPEWLSGSTCGKFATPNTPMTFGRYKTVYNGVHIVTFNLLFTYTQSCDVSVCFVINGRNLQSFDKQSCFERYLNETSSVTTSTIGGSELLYMKEGYQVSLKLKITCQMTVLNRSSLSVFYLGTKEAPFGFSSIIGTSKAPLSVVLPRRRRYYYDIWNNDLSTTYEVQGWTTNVKKSKMFFKRGITFPLNEMFVCPRTGVYLILVKLRTKRVNQMLNQLNGCVVSATLAVNNSDTNVGVRQTFYGGASTLSFTTTMMLRKWQALTVRFKYETDKCGNMEIKQGSSFGAVYIANGEVPSTWWPDVGPHIVKVPPTNAYVRTDKPNFSNLTCKAVGEDSITYQWIKYYNEVISKSSTLDVKKLNSTSSTVVCVATMGKFVTRSSRIFVELIDPTLEFVDLYSNITYDVQEENGTEPWSYTAYSNVLTFGVREKVAYRWYYRRTPIKCYITKGDHSNTFYITQNYQRYSYNTKFFSLRARKKLVDREATEEFYLKITCINNEFKDAANATTTIHVKILDANDNLPVFEQSIYNATIPGNLHPGEDIIQVIATDDDAGENGEIKYKLLDTPDSYIFVIDKLSGVISLSRYGLLAKSYYILSVQAMDGGNPPRSGQTIVFLVVQGYGPNRNRTNYHPVFKKPEYKATMIKTAPIGSRVTKVHAYDPDTHDENTVFYSIYSDSSHVFQVDSKTGVITTKGKLSVKNYTLEIAAEYVNLPPDKHDSERYKTITEVTVIVTNVDVTKPNFLKSQYTAKVSEGANVSTSVLKVTAVDTELSGQSYLNYSILCPGDAFDIDSRSGEIRVAAKLDYEKTKHYMCFATVKEVPNTAKSSWAVVTIDVSDVNDNTPKIIDAPRQIELNEHTALGTCIGQVIAHDRDSGYNGIIKYYLVNVSPYLDERAFHIDRDNGTIFLIRNPHCCDDVNVIVEVKDQGTPPRSTTVNIRIVLKPTGHHGNLEVIITASVSGGILILVLVTVAVYCIRHKRHQNYINATGIINYTSLQTDNDDDDDELLDVNTGDENERRLSLVSQTSGQSVGSEEHLLPSEVQC